MSRIGLPILEEDDDDPVLSIVNVVDVFLVIMTVLLIILMSNPLNPFATEDEVVVITNANQPDMQIKIREGEKLISFRTTGEIGEGRGNRAGTAYRLEDGSMIYVPE